MSTKSQELIKDAAYYLQQIIESDAPYVKAVLLRCCVLPGEEVNLITSTQLLGDWYFKLEEREWEEEERAREEEEFLKEMEVFIEEEYIKCGYF